jgi:hypothetical protein
MLYFFTRRKFDMRRSERADHGFPQGKIYGVFTDQAGQQFQISALFHIYEQRELRRLNCLRVLPRHHSPEPRRTLNPEGHAHYSFVMFFDLV